MVRSGFRPLIAPLFVPATRPDRFHKAAASGADAIIVDLEDAVPAADKDSAREALVGKLDDIPVPVFLRINPRSTEWHGPDLGIVSSLPVAGIVLAKTECASDLKLIAARVGAQIPVVGLVETALGIAELQRISEAPNLAQVAFGSLDFALDIGAEYDQGSLAFARGQIILFSRAHRLPAPLDGVTTAIEDTKRLQTDCRFSCALGFGGKLAIHPSQIHVIREAFRPTDSDVEWAQRIVTAVQGTNGAVAQVDGAMVDAPVIEKARRILERSRSDSRGSVG